MSHHSIIIYYFIYLLRTQYVVQHTVANGTFRHPGHIWCTCSIPLEVIENRIFSIKRLFCFTCVDGRSRTNITRYEKWVLTYALDRVATAPLADKWILVEGFY